LVLILAKIIRNKQPFYLKISLMSRLLPYSQGYSQA
jgi:hypothetical protein